MKKQKNIHITKPCYSCKCCSMRRPINGSCNNAQVHHMFTNRTVQFHVVAEDHLHVQLKNIFNEWVTVKSGQVMFKLYSLHFPSGENAGEWKRLFKPCAAQRLFLLDVLDSIDSVLYLDTDVLLLRPVEDLWNHFEHLTLHSLLPCLQRVRRQACHGIQGLHVIHFLEKME
ncbi:Glucoside xylosyltransferase 2 [Desmophyllum pertusum]|uniref:Glucoside xylosyltransferase 2 n=1 Tax=Desmophyllum pertusum TaxID=174260 RepID=A0A9X0CWM3_9CNID|nr:Glucoside xylosyltransferase 2 [Desmophyllum pertusum]